MSRSIPLSTPETVGGNQAAVADYVQQMSGELAGLAMEAGLDLLAYLLDMVRIEADLVKRRIAGEKPSGC